MRARTKFLHPEPGRDRARFTMRNPACASPQQQRARPLTPTHTQGVDRIMRRLEEIRAELGAEIKEARSGALARAGGRPARSTVRTSAGAGRASSQFSRLYISPKCNMRGWELRKDLLQCPSNCRVGSSPHPSLSHSLTHLHTHTVISCAADWTPSRAARQRSLAHSPLAGAATACPSPARERHPKRRSWGSLKSIESSGASSKRCGRSKT